MFELSKLFCNRLLLNETMSKHSTLRLGGAAKYFLAVKNEDEIAQAVSAAKEENISYVVIGGGSNILVSDSGFNGLVIKMSDSEIKIDEEKIYAGAGVFSTMLGRVSAEAGIAGLEWMATLPGTIGGAVYGNAGAYGEETKDKLLRVRILESGIWNLESGSLKRWLDKSECGFGYRDSRFKKTKEIILGAEFALLKDDKAAIKEKMNMLLEKRKDEQPLGSSSAGCIFKNFRFMISDFRFDVPEEFLENKMIPAGWLIDKAGMKGFRVGRVSVSEQHGNFFLTQAGATADDLVMIISVVKRKVRDKFGIELQEEVQYIGF